MFEKIKLHNHFLKEFQIIFNYNFKKEKVQISTIGTNSKQRIKYTKANQNAKQVSLSAFCQALPAPGNTAGHINRQSQAKPATEIKDRHKKHFKM